LAAQPPALGAPAVLGPRERQDPADHAACAAVEDPGEPLALLGIVEPGRARIDVDRQARLGPQQLPGGPVRRLPLPVDPRRAAPPFAEPPRRCHTAIITERARRPQRQPVAPRDDVERPARQALAGILLAHAVEDDTAGRQAIAQLVRQPPPAGPLV